jgi:hypothetical protein
MKRHLTQIAGSIVLAGSLIGVGYAQDTEKPLTEKQARREVKRDVKDAKGTVKSDRWADRKESKLIKRMEKDQKFNTPTSARGSEVKYIDSQGRYVSLGYIDKVNKFRPYQK